MTTYLMLCVVFIILSPFLLSINHILYPPKSQVSMHHQIWPHTSSAVSSVVIYWSMTVRLLCWFPTEEFPLWPCKIILVCSLVDLLYYKIETLRSKHSNWSVLLPFGGYRLFWQEWTYLVLPVPPPRQ